MTSTERRSWAIAAAVLLAVVCALFWEALLTGRVLSQADFLLTRSPWSVEAPPGDTYVAANALLRDQSEQFIPWRRFAVDAMRDGTLPLWNPYNYCGAPFVGNDQSAIFYPTMLLYLILPFHAAGLLAALLRLMVAGTGMYALLRRFRVTFGPALVAAIAFMLCGSMVVWLNHPHSNVMVWLPWLLLAVDRCFDPGGVRAAGWLGLVIGLQFLGGHIETSMILALAAGLLLGFRWVRRRRARPLLLAGAGVLLGVAVGAVQLLPVAEYLRHSRVVAQRGSEAHVARVTSQGVWWRAMPALAMPGLYGNPVRSPVMAPSVFKPGLALRNYNERNGAYVGVPMLLLGIIGATLAGHRQHAAYFATLGLLAVSLAYRLPPIYPLFLLLPGMTLTAEMLVRVQLLLALAFCALGAFALDGRLAGSPLPRRGLRRAALVAGVTGSIGACVWGVRFALRDRPDFERAGEMLRTGVSLPADAAERVASTFATSGVVLVVSVALSLGLWIWGRRVFGSRVWLSWAVLVAADLFVFAYGYNPIVPPGDVFPDTPAIGFLREHLGSGRMATLNTFGGSTATWYGFRDIRGYDAIEVHDYAWLTRSRAGVSPAMMRALGVRYVVADPHTRLPARLVHDGDARIYELPGAMPRATVVGRAVLVDGADRAGVLEQLRDPGFDPATTVLLEAADDVNRTGPPGVAEIVRDGVNEVVIEARTPSGGWLVLADTYFPGWRVEVDGRPAELLRANFVFRAVRLEAGDRLIRFHYRPRAFQIGAVLSVVGLLGVCAAIFATPRTAMRTALD